MNVNAIRERQAPGCLLKPNMNKDADIFFFFFEKWIQADILIKEMRILQYKRQDIRWNTLQPNMRG